MTAPDATGTAADLMNSAGTIAGEFTEAGAVPGNVSAVWNSLTQAMAQARMAVNGALSRVEALRADDMIPAAGRDRQIREAIAAAETALPDHVRHIDANLTVMRAALEQAALPQVATGAEQLARIDARMLLDASPDPHTAMMRLASRQDDIGALVTSGWGRDYLASRGMDDAAFHQGVRAAGVQAAEQAPDAARATAARYAARMATLEQARDVLVNGAQAALAGLVGR